MASPKSIKQPALLLAQEVISLLEKKRITQEEAVAVLATAQSALSYSPAQRSSQAP